MLDFNTLLELADIDPARTLIVRHVPVERRLKRALPTLVVDRPDLWLAYQQIQWESLEKAMVRAGFVASFIGQEAAEATYAGFYRIGTSHKLDFDAYRSLPGNAELEALGMAQRPPDMPDCLAFDLEPLPVHDEWIGKLTINWPKPFQQWWRWGGRGAFPVAAIADENRFAEAVPDWTELVLRWSELGNLPASWKAALAQWRGVYFIFDRARGAGYVGSASGSDNILGRWLEYARTGHGGNRELKASMPEDLSFSILQLTSPDLEVAQVVALEASWKERLHTKDHGLNAN